ncbi:MAG TPA: winged helix-turn-helix domain-containing protein [Rhodanobacter sp.]|nr:winged helix-turn-helix domain-containing protein [Rhodanobacter sp.]
MSAQEYGVYRFASCELDPREHRLLVRGQPVALTPKVFETLVLLVERAGHVVSKDELMAALWPRGFVHESNLTKHIWLIRRALGDDEGDNRCIETVPKFGYRFVAEVCRVPGDIAPDAAVPSPADSASPAPPAAATALPSDAEAALAKFRHDETTGSAVAAAPARPRRRWPVAAAAGVLLACIVLGGFLLWHSRHMAVARDATALDAGAVAVVGFNNLSGDAGHAWLGPAMAEMLATEITIGGKLHALPDELVRPACTDLAPPEIGGYAPASLARLQRRLGAHYVLSGSYLVSGAADAPQLRLDLAVQDTRNGRTVATLSRSGPVNSLPQLIAQAGVDLRGDLGLQPATPETLRLVADAQPPTAEVARHIGIALDALRRYDPARARDELLQAVAQAPGYAPAYMHLARAWSMLGYRAKALAASRQALANTEGLPEETRLQVQAQQAALQGDAPQNVAAFAKLVALRPQNPDYRLQLVAALNEAGRYDQANAALAELRRLPVLAGDPRVELAAVDVATTHGGMAAAASHARLALQQAQRRGEAGLVAEAQLRLGIALDQGDQAEPMLRASAEGFRRLGNPHGEAHAWQNLGNLLGNHNQLAAARESYQRAMTLYQGIGDLGGEAAIYDNLSIMLWSAGDRDGTETALRQALAIGRETDDKVRQAWSLTGLATVLSDESAGDEVAAMYQQAIALDRQANRRSHLVFAMANYADLLRVRGQLDEARTVCGQAMDITHELDAAGQGGATRFECAQVLLDRGEVAAATAELDKIKGAAVASKDAFTAANTEFVLGQIAMGRARWRDARKLLQESLAGWTAQQEEPGIANASALLALCADALGDKAGRESLTARARDLRAAINQRQEVFLLDVSLAELRAYGGEYDVGLAQLRALADDAAKRSWASPAFEARLAVQRVLDRDANRAVAQAYRRVLKADAQKAGYGWVAQRLVLTQDTPAGTR